MGEATYYLKAHFSSPEAAEAALPRLREFLVESGRAGNWWQQNRHLAPAVFWPQFRAQFPLITAFLADFKPTLLDKDCNNALAGELDFYNAWEEDAGDIAYTLERDGATLTYWQTVWHFADWDGLEAWCYQQLGAVKVGWLSDEYINPFELL